MSKTLSNLPQTSVSVVIPALNEERNVAAAVTSARAAGACEVIVVDGGSHDQTETCAVDAGAVVISAARGRGAQQNAGAAAACGELLVFLHADSTLAPVCIAQARRAHLGGHTHGAFRQRIDAIGFGYRCLEIGNGWRVRAMGLPYGDQAIFVDRDLFLAAGGFPETQLMEDWLLMKRMRWQHWPVLLPGPVHVSARRWQENGIARQTLTNWSLSWSAWLGADPSRLAKRYSNHTEAAIELTTALPDHPQSVQRHLP